MDDLRTSNSRAINNGKPIFANQDSPTVEFKVEDPHENLVYTAIREMLMTPEQYAQLTGFGPREISQRFLKEKEAPKNRVLDFISIVAINLYRESGLKAVIDFTKKIKSNRGLKRQIYSAKHIFKESLKSMELKLNDIKTPDLVQKSRSLPRYLKTRARAIVDAALKATNAQINTKIIDKFLGFKEGTIGEYLSRDSDKVDFTNPRELFLRLVGLAKETKNGKTIRNKYFKGFTSKGRKHTKQDTKLKAKKEPEPIGLQIKLAPDRELVKNLKVRLNIKWKAYKSALGLSDKELTSRKNRTISLNNEGRLLHYLILRFLDRLKPSYAQRFFDEFYQVFNGVPVDKRNKAVIKSLLKEISGLDGFSEKDYERIVGLKEGTVKRRLNGDSKMSQEESLFIYAVSKLLREGGLENLKKYFGEFLEVDNDPERKLEAYKQMKEQVKERRNDDKELLEDLEESLGESDSNVLSKFMGIPGYVLSSVKDATKRFTKAQRVLVQLLNEGAKTEEGKAYISFLGLK